VAATTMPRRRPPRGRVGELSVRRRQYGVGGVGTFRRARCKRPAEPTQHLANGRGRRQVSVAPLGNVDGKPGKVAGKQRERRKNGDDPCGGKPGCYPAHPDRSHSAHRATDLSARFAVQPYVPVGPDTLRPAAYALAGFPFWRVSAGRLSLRDRRGAGYSHFKRPILTLPRPADPRGSPHSARGPIAAPAALAQLYFTGCEANCRQLSSRYGTRPRRMPRSPTIWSPSARPWRLSRPPASAPRCRSASASLPSSCGWYPPPETVFASIAGIAISNGRF